MTASKTTKTILGIAALAMAFGAGAADKGKDRKGNFTSGGSKYGFLAVTKKYTLQQEGLFLKSKMDSCLLANKDKQYCVCYVNYYLEEHGISREKLMDYHYAFQRVTTGRDGKMDANLVMKYRNDPAFRNYFEYARQAANSCDAKFRGARGR